MPKPVDSNPRRIHDRWSSLIDARIGANDLWQDCQIVNISVGGARLLLCEQLDIPQALLEIGNLGRFRTLLAWQKGNDAGVKFDHDPTEMAEVVMGLATYGSWGRLLR